MIKKISRAFFWIVMLAVILCAVTCAVNPVSGKKELMLFSEKAEIALGQNTDQEIRQQYGIYADKELNDYVSHVGRKMVPYSHRPNLQYYFAVLDTPVINAFAAPGGYIYVTRGIMALMNSEAELAVVLGHEIGHVTARHSVKRLSGQLLISVGLILGSALNEDIAKVAGLFGIGTQLLFLKYSRSDEYQADALGIGYARQAAYSPVEMMHFFSALEKMSADSGGTRLPTFLSTHPMTEDRIKKVREMLSSKDARLAVKKEDYLRQVDGMVYGENPQQGFVEDRVFYHPELTFYFFLPADWTVENTPKQVMITPKNGKAALVLQAEPSDLALEEFLSVKARELDQAQLLEKNRNAVNGLQAIHAFYKVPQGEREPLRVRLSCIRKDNMIYSFSAVSSNVDFNDYQQVFTDTIHSFQRLHDSRYLNRKPSHLTLVRPDGRQSLQAILSATGVERKLWKQLAVFNALRLDSIPDSSLLMKIVK